MFFKIFPIKIYTLLHAFEPIVRALLPLWLRYLQNIHSERINLFFKCRKTLTSYFIFTYGNKNKSFGLKSGLYGGWLIKPMFWTVINAVVGADVWELILSFSTAIRLRQLVFLISWKTTGKQMIVHHSELTFLRYSSGTIEHVQFFRKNRRAWKCFVREQLLLDLAHLETPIQSTAVYFRAHTRKPTIHQVSRCHRRCSKHFICIYGAFLLTNRHEPFFERLENCVGSNANKFFWQPNAHAILSVCWSH